MREKITVELIRYLISDAYEQFVMFESLEWWNESSFSGSREVTVLYKSTPLNATFSVFRHSQKEVLSQSHLTVLPSSSNGILFNCSTDFMVCQALFVNPTRLF